MSQGEEGAGKPAFDFRNLINMDPAAKDQLLRGEIYDQFEQVNQRLSPMIWALAWREMEKANGDGIVLNAILNSVVSAVAMFVAASVDDEGFIEEICEKLQTNFRNCYAQRATAREIIGTSAPGVGRAMLIEESLPGIRDLVAQVSKGLGGVMQGLATVSTQVDNLGKG